MPSRHSRMRASLPRTSASSHQISRPPPTSPRKPAHMPARCGDWRRGGWHSRRRGWLAGRHRRARHPGRRAIHRRRRVRGCARRRGYRRGVGAIAGALVGMGIPEEEAKYYEGEVKSGRTLVTVRADGRSAEATQLLRLHGAYDMESAGQTVGATRDLHGDRRRNVSDNPRCAHAGAARRGARRPARPPFKLAKSPLARTSSRSSARWRCPSPAKRCSSSGMPSIGGETPIERTGGRPSSAGPRRARRPGKAPGRLRGGRGRQDQVQETRRGLGHGAREEARIEREGDVTTDTGLDATR